MNAVAALLVAFCVSVVMALVLAFPCSGLHPAMVWASLGAGVVVGSWQYGNYLRTRKPEPPAAKAGPWERAVIVVFILFSLRAFCWLVYESDDNIEFISSNNLGDLALHLTYIRNLALGAPFWPENPIFAGIKLHYPIGVDLFNSLLTVTGVDVYRGLVWVGLVSSLVTGITLYKWGRGFTIAGFLFNGGLAGFLIFQTLKLADFQADLGWKSIPLSMLVTQRGMLYAIPAGLVVLWSWRKRFFTAGEEQQANPPLPLWVEILLYSTMPLFHLHTFLFLSFLLGCWFVALFARWFAKLPAAGLGDAFKLIACSLLPATALVFLVSGGFGNGTSMIHLPGDWMWMYNEQPGFAKWADGFGLPHPLAGLLGRTVCWLVNFGLFPFLVLPLLAELRRDYRTPAGLKAAAFIVPAVGIFILSGFVMFARWDWDNTKLMVWPYLVLLPFLWDRLVAKWPPIARLACCFVLFFSGFVTLVGGIDSSHTGYDLASRLDLDGVASAVKSLPPTAIFAAYPTYNHPLLLNGRKVVAGYTGHLWSHGIDYEDQLAQVESILKGDPDWQQTANDLNVGYIFWGPEEMKAYPDSTRAWEQSCAKVAEGSWGTIYAVKQAPPLPGSK